MKKFAIVAAFSILLVGCVSARPVSGPVSTSASSIMLARTWSDISDYTRSETPTARVMTLDGPALNRLYVTDVKVGESMVRALSKEKPTPVLRADLSFNEQVEFVLDSIAALGYFRVESRDLRPQKFGTADGLRFEIDAQTQGGLNIAGTALATMTNGQFHLLLFLAPQEHYYAASSGEVETIFGSAGLN